MKELGHYKGVIMVLLLVLPFLMYSQGNSENRFLKKITIQAAGLNQGQLQKLERIRQNPINKDVQLVKVGSIEALQNRGALPIIIPGRKGALVAHVISVETLSDDNYTWYGEFRKEEHGYVHIQAKNGAIYGQINIENEIYLLQDLGNGKNVLLKLDASKFGPDECATPQSSVEQEAPKSKANDEVQSRTHCNTNVRVLVLFTDAADQVGNPQNDANLFIGQTNQACRNSAISQHDLNFELVGVERLDGFIEGLNIQDDLTNPGRFTDLMNQNNSPRNLNEADIVILLSDGNYDNNGTFGIAWVDPGNDQRAYGIVEIDAAGGRFTFAHEVAHIFGADHDEPRFGFANGRRFNSGFWRIFNTRRTILANLGTSGARIQNYSNPDVEFGGVETGVENERDNARQIEARACDVADYRDTQDPPNVEITGPTQIIEYTQNWWCANITNCAGNNPQYAWAYSYNGFTFFNGGTGTCFSTFPTQTGGLTIRLTVTCNGLQGIDFHQVSISNGFTGGGVSSRSAESISNGDYLGDINLYPNPATEDLHINVEIKQPGNLSIELLDISGRIKNVTHDKLDKGVYSMMIPLGKYANGVYYIRVTSADVVTTKQILIQK